MKNIADKGYVIYVFHGVMHYGVYVGDGKVIHYSTDDDSLKPSNAYIHLTTLEKFRNGSKVYYLSDEELASRGAYIYPPEEVVHRAYSRLGEREYNLLYNNCEQFALWCKTGNHQSIQINSIGGILLDITATIAFEKSNVSFSKESEDMIDSIVHIIAGR